MVLSCEEPDKTHKIDTNGTNVALEVGIILNIRLPIRGLGKIIQSSPSSKRK